MIRSLYTSGWSMLAKSKQMDVISNNLANVNTNGYKRDIAVFESFPDVLTRRINDKTDSISSKSDIGSLQLGSDIGMIHTNYTEGKMMKTNSRLDFAIDLEDKAFFTIGIKNELGTFDEFYTRDGVFSLGPDGYLVNQKGEYVLGENGAIKVDSDEIEVGNGGEVSYDGNIIDKLKIKQFKDTSVLRKIGDNLITAIDGAEEEEFSGVVRQGFVEQSNVNTVKEMVDMINVMRSYEASQKLMQFMDGTLEKATNEVGAVR